MSFPNVFCFFFFLTAAPVCFIYLSDFLTALGFSLVGFSLVAVHKRKTVDSLMAEQGLEAHRLQSLQVVGSRAPAQ